MAKSIQTALIRESALYRRNPTLIPLKASLTLGLSLMAPAIISGAPATLPSPFVFAMLLCVFLLCDLLIVPVVLLGPNSSRKIEKLISTSCQKQGYIVLWPFSCFLSWAVIKTTKFLPLLGLCGLSITILSGVKFVARPRDFSGFACWITSSYVVVVVVVVAAFSNRSSSLLSFTVLLPLLLAWAALVCGFPDSVKNLLYFLCLLFMYSAPDGKVLSHSNPEIVIPSWAL